MRIILENIKGFDITFSTRDVETHSELTDIENSRHEIYSILIDAGAKINELRDRAKDNQSQS